jgi:type IV pilus assembly protein PilV
MSVIFRQGAQRGLAARRVHFMRRGLQAARGVSLIEVLVSIVIASMGILALAGVNATAVRYTKMSQYRSTAALLASEMGERIRANKGQPAAAAVVGPPAIPAVAASGFFAGDYDFTTDFAGQAAAPAAPVLTSVPGPCHSVNEAGDNCSVADIAALDLWQWRVQVRNLLPEGSAYISTDLANSAVDLYVVWRDPAVANDNAPTAANECVNGLNLGADVSVRCSYFRIHI